MYNNIAYGIYLFCSFVVVVRVGRILHTNGRAYLFEECPDKHLSEAANNLLYVGYCLLNIGFAFYHLNTCDVLRNWTQVLEFIASSEGFILIVLAIMHIINMLFAPKIITFFLPKSSKLTDH